MSIKHVKQYYTQMESQYFEMQQNLKELKQDYEDGMIPSEVVAQMEQLVLPLKQNYERLSYIMYLLLKPAKESKKWYDKQHCPVLQRIKDMKATKEDCAAENQDVLVRFKQYVKTLQETVDGN